jgi:hypothetical protein
MPCSEGGLGGGSKMEITIKVYWDEYATIVSMSESEFICQCFLVLKPVAKQQYVRVHKIGSAMPYKLGVSLLFGESENYFSPEGK